MYRSPNDYWKNYSSFLNVLAVFQQYIVLRMFMLNHRSLQELEKVEELKVKMLEH